MAVKNYIQGEKEIRSYVTSAYLAKRESPFEQCGYCGCDVVWKQLLDDAELRAIPNPVFATVEHIVPILQGGSSMASNLMTACAKCNSERSVRVPKPKNGKLRKWRNGKPVKSVMEEKGNKNA